MLVSAWSCQAFLNLMEIPMPKNTTPADSPSGDSQIITSDAPLIDEQIASTSRGVITSSETATTTVRLLTICDYGVANDVVTLPEAVAADLVKSGTADDQPSAVRYARTLEQNR